jgi:hypothetical protein
MANYALIRGRALRVTRLDGCGNPVTGPDSVVATKGFISVGLTANTEEGEAISVPNANGDICISDTPPPKFTGYGVEVNLCGVNPNLVNLLTGQPLVYDAETVNPAVIGFRVNSKVNLDDSGFALEMWSGVPAAACEPGTGQQYGYLLLPFVKGGVLGDLTVENGPVNFIVTGAQTKDGSGWGVGPYNVTLDASDQEAPLTEPITVGDHLHVQLTSVPPPNTDGDVEALGVEATTGVAGIPGTYTPANSYGRASVAELIADPLIASPNTAWTTGQYITNRDGSKAHWNATAWVAGPA